MPPKIRRPVNLRVRACNRRARCHNSSILRSSQFPKHPRGLRRADFNRDAIPDLLIAYFDSTVVSVLLENGDGSFQAPKTSALGTAQPDEEPLAVGDFNLDGIPDVALASGWATENRFESVATILLGNGDGTFKAPVSVPFVSSYGFLYLAERLVVGDFNGDGKPDLPVPNNGCTVDSCKTGNISLLLVNIWRRCGGATVSVLLGKGDGTFGTPQAFAIAYDQSSRSR